MPWMSEEERRAREEDPDFRDTMAKAKARARVLREARKAGEKPAGKGIATDEEFAATLEAVLERTGGRKLRAA